MINNSNIKININDSGVKEFIKLVTENDFSKDKIKSTLSCPAYRQLIEVGGRNIGIYTEEEWVELFYNALNTEEKELEKLMNSKIDLTSFIKSNIYKTVYNTKNNIDQLKIYNDILKKEISKEDFVKIALQYLPDCINDKEITINLVIFSDNAFGIDNQMIIDAQFLGKLDTKYIKAILAHELHHMLREQFYIDYRADKKYELIYQILYWLENEGIADMCNFDITKNLFEDYGYYEKGNMNQILDHIDLYLKNINDLFFDILNNKPYNIKFFEKFERSAYHPVGNTMAKRIINIGGIDMLKSCVGDMIRFLFKYQECAQKAGNIYIFNKDVLQEINKVFRK